MTITRGRYINNGYLEVSRTMIEDTGRLHHFGISYALIRAHIRFLIHGLQINVIDAGTPEIYRDFRLAGKPLGPTKGMPSADTKATQR